MFLDIMSSSLKRETSALTRGDRFASVIIPNHACAWVTLLHEPTKREPKGSRCYARSGPIRAPKGAAASVRFWHGSWSGQWRAARFAAPYFWGSIHARPTSIRLRRFRISTKHAIQNSEELFFSDVLPRNPHPHRRGDRGSGLLLLLDRFRETIT